MRLGFSKKKRPPQGRASARGCYPRGSSGACNSIEGIGLPNKPPNKRIAAHPSERVVAYIDGFNLYHGLKDSQWRRFYWLNVQGLADRLLRRAQQLVSTKYFTARIAGSKVGDSPKRARYVDARRKRQSTYLDALATLSGFEMYGGHFLGKKVECWSCGADWRTHEEKMTDVQIATQMLTDAFADRYDMAMVVSADSDLVPPISAIRHLFPEKRIVVAFPPARHSLGLTRAANACFTIGRGVLRQSQFPETVRKADGFTLKRPNRWR